MLKKIAWSDEETTGSLFWGYAFLATLCLSFLSTGAVVVAIVSHTSISLTVLLTVAAVVSDTLFAKVILSALRDWRQERTIKKLKGSGKLIQIEHYKYVQFRFSNSPALDALMNKEIGNDLWRAMQEDRITNTSELKAWLESLKKGQHATLFAQLRPVLDHYLGETAAYSGLLAEVRSTASPGAITKAARNMRAVAAETAAKMRVIIDHYQQTEREIKKQSAVSAQAVADTRIELAKRLLP